MPRAAGYNKYMLDSGVVMATIPVTELLRAQEFYQNTLGLKPGQAFPNGIIMHTKNKTAVALFQRPPTNRQNTAAWFVVNNFDETVKELRAKQVSFDEYDMPGMSSLGEGIYQFGSVKAAWFKDSEGNILSITENFTK